MYVMSFPDSHSVMFTGQFTDHAKLTPSRHCVPLQCRTGLWFQEKRLSAAKYLYPFIECNNQKSTSTLPPKNSFLEMIFNDLDLLYFFLTFFQI